MRGPARALIAAVGLVVIPAPARADVEGKCVSMQCPAGSPREFEVFSCETPSCVCWNSCGDDSAQPGRGNLVTGLARLTLGVVFYSVGLAILPGFLVEKGLSQAKIDELAAAARRAFADHRKQVAELAVRGRRLVRLEEELRADESAAALCEERPRAALPAEWDWGADDLRDGPHDERPAPRKRPRPVPQPRLAPSLDFQCNQARVLVPFHVGGPIAGFASEGEMLERCRDHYRPPLGPAANGLDCGVATRAGAPARCPPSHPYFNPCSDECFADTDFRGTARRPEGLRCTRSVHCGLHAR